MVTKVTSKNVRLLKLKTVRPIFTVNEKENQSVQYKSLLNPFFIIIHRPTSLTLGFVYYNSELHTHTTIVVRVITLSISHFVV